MKTTQVLLNSLLFCFCIILTTVTCILTSFGLRAKPASDNFRYLTSSKMKEVKEAKKVLDVLKLSRAERAACEPYIKARRIAVGVAQSTILRAEREQIAIWPRLGRLVNALPPRPRGLVLLCLFPASLNRYISLDMLLIRSLVKAIITASKCKRYL